MDRLPDERRKELEAVLADAAAENAQECSTRRSKELLFVARESTGERVPEEAAAPGSRWWRPGRCGRARSRLGAVADFAPCPVVTAGCAWATCSRIRQNPQRRWSQGRAVVCVRPGHLGARDRAAPAHAGDGPGGVSGNGVVVGCLDFGFDFATPNLRNEDGSSRVLSLWDQRGGAHPDSPAPFGYGRELQRAAMDAALTAPDPYAALAYDPADADSAGHGAHGTHVLDIAAGNGRAAGSAAGVAHRRGPDRGPLPERRHATGGRPRRLRSAA